MERPQLDNCGRLAALNLPCQNRNKAKEAEWLDQTRRFSTPTEFAKADGTTPSQAIEYQIGGCWGSIVNMEIAAPQLSSLRYELLAPSGTTVASEQIGFRGGSFVGRPIELPESGFYRMRLTVGAAGTTGRVCKERKNLVGECTRWENATTYPYKFTVAFRGNAEAPVIRVGERGDGTVTQAEPRSRRVTVEAGQQARAIVRATGGQVACRAQRADRTTLPVTSASGGCEVAFPETDRDATYMISLTSATNAPVGVSILVEAAAAPKAAAAAEPRGSAGGTLQLGTDVEGVFEVSVAPGAPGGASEARWALDVPTAGTYSLTVVPSGLAALEVGIMMYNEKTEEVIVDGVRVAARQVVPLTFPVAGRHVLLLKPLKYDAQRAQGKAKYTLRIDRAVTPRVVGK